MRRILLLCGLALFVLSSIAYTANVSDAGAVPQDPSESVYESIAKGYEEAAKKCAKEAYDLNLQMQQVRDTPFEFRGAAWGRLYVLLQVDYREKCRDYHYYLRVMQEARARIPTPTPTPTPASPDPVKPQPEPSPTSSPEKKIVEPPDELRNRLAKFLKEQEELKDKADKLLKEINDHIKKAKSGKPKPRKPGYETEFDATSGLFIVRFTTPQGVLRVHLPDDMRAGDTISGTVEVEPIGQTNEERARNLENLNRYQLKIANETLTGPWGPFTWEWLKKIPQPTPSPKPSPSPLDKFPPQIAMPPSEGGNVELEIELINLIAPVRMKLPEPPSTSDPSASSKMNLPTIGQNGRSVKIEGPFDGRVGTTQVRVGGQPVTVLAESPRGCVFKSPEQNFGPTEVTIKENNVETKGTYRNIGVRLDAPKTSLSTGESTTMTADVRGLQGIQKDVPLHLQAEGVIIMEGGNYQYLSIRPQDVKADGRYTTTRTITGQQTGGFGVTATVLNPRADRQRLAQKLRQIRTALGFSLSEMPKRLGLDESIKYSTLSDYESGFDRPPLTILLQYARLANVTMDVLIDDELDLPAKLPGEKKEEDRK